MTIALRYAAYSDVGCLREGNEDSGYAGPHLLAVADGMGGYAGGEIASSIAIATLLPLDDDVPGTDMSGALEEAVEQANTSIAQRVREDPKLENMGTTLTAMLWSGARVALIHVGDSRAYLLRDGEFQQITHDHTLVQTLVDEGKITEEEVATHPQRSLILRALNGQGQVEPDISIREAQVGDRYLLCSDGLAGVISKETIHETLAGEKNAEAATRRLIDLANRGGGPDNITVVIADVIDTATDAHGPTSAQQIVGAADQRREPLMTPDTPAGRAQELKRGSGDTAEMERIPEPPPSSDGEDRGSGNEPKPRRWWPMVIAFLLIVGVFATAGFFLIQWYLGNQYFIGPDGEETNVAVYQGIDTDIAGYSLAEQIEDTGIPLAMLPANERELVTSSVAFEDRDQVEARVSDLRAIAEECEADPASCGLPPTDGDSEEDSAAPEETDATADGAEETADSEPTETESPANNVSGEQ